MKWWLMLFILPVVCAAGIDKALTTVILEDSSAEITTQYAIISERIESLSINLSTDAKIVSADMDDELRECKLNNGTALCGSTKKGKHVFTINYKSKVLASLDDRQLFSFNDQLPFKTNEYTFVLKLPVGTIIPQEEGKDADFFLTPKPTQVLSDGQRIIITWNATNLHNFAVSAVLQPLNSVIWKYIVGALIALLVGITATWHFLKNRKIPKNAKNTPKRKKTDVLVPQFVENEQKVVQLITEAPNKEVWQKQLLAQTGFSKAKLSRIIRNLEERGVVVKTIYGNTNKISLKN